MQWTIRTLFWIIVPILILTIALATYFYPEEYKFAFNYISQLGGQITPINSFDNHISSILMSVGFGLCATISFVTAFLYFFSDFSYKYLKGSMCLLIALGGSCTAIPTDKGNLLILHTIGAIIFILGFAVLNFTLQLMRFIRKRQQIVEKRSFDFYLDAVVVVLLITIIVILSFLFILSETTHNSILEMLAITFQKIVLIVSCLAILLLDLDDI
jgi:hypothetical protein